MIFVSLGTFLPRAKQKGPFRVDGINAFAVGAFNTEKTAESTVRELIMTKRILAAPIFVFSVCAFAQDNQPLQVGFDTESGCPTAVESVDESCGNGPDPVNVACRSNGATVRWTPGSSIDQIRTKADSSGDLHNCRHVEEFYQCVVQGNVDDDIVYDVVATNGCILDPIIRVR